VRASNPTAKPRSAVHGARHDVPDLHITINETVTYKSLKVTHVPSVADSPKPSELDHASNAIYVV
jgi:hypothetical protein